VRYQEERGEVFVSRGTPQREEGGSIHISILILFFSFLKKG
jgi:hypothetical protein